MWLINCLLGKFEKLSSDLQNPREKHSMAPVLENWKQVDPCSSLANIAKLMSSRFSETLSPKAMWRVMEEDT